MQKFVPFFNFFLCVVVSAGPLVPHNWSCQLLLNEASLDSKISKYSDYLNPAVFNKLLQLGNLSRSGWLRRGVPKSEAEDVFAHTIKVARAAEIIAEKRVNIDKIKLIQMALIHDIAELGKIGDVTPFDGISHEKKILGEREALEEFLTQNPEEFSGVIELWNEFESQVTGEAILLFNLDKIDSAIQAMRYEKKGYATEDFYPYVKERINDPFLASVFDRVLNALNTTNDPYKLYFELLSTQH